MRDSEALADASAVDRMRDRLAHRGPDDAGTWSRGSVALGHRRLSVIDLSAAGHQPMLSPDGDCAIVYNGEVYNFPELRAELAKRGHRFRGDSDTEVILTAYLEYGPSFVTHLNGMFALAIWDESRQRLVLARDRMGIKPLYVHEGADRLAFASEIKSLLALPEVDRAWDEQALHDYFHFLYVPGPRTAYRSISQLPPGTLRIVERGVSRDERYWDLAPAGGRSADAEEELLDLVRDAVRLRTVADVPIGCFLSGGVDSGLIVALMSGALTEPVRSFTVFDPDVPFYDERSRAASVAERYGTLHAEIEAATEVGALLDLLVPTFDEPFADSGALPNLVVCREGRKHVTVALSGLGGDELSAGYLRYLGMKVNAATGRLPGVARRLLASLADRLPEGSGLTLDRAKRFARLVGLGEAAAWLQLVSAGGRVGRSILNSDFRGRIDEDAPLAHVEARLTRARELGCDPVNRWLYTDLVTYIPDDLLPLADRTSMRWGLEVRVPLLDHRVVELSLAIPGSRKIQGMRQKVLLRDLARPLLPSSVVDGAKRGFSVPMAEWLRGPLANEIDDVVRRTGPETGVLDAATLLTAWEEHRSGRASHEEILWAALVFTRWARGA